MTTKIIPLSHRAWILHSLLHDPKNLTTTWDILTLTELKPSDAVNHIVAIKWLHRNHYISPNEYYGTHNINLARWSMTERGIEAAKYLEQTTPLFIHDAIIYRLDSLYSKVSPHTSTSMDIYWQAREFYRNQQAYWCDDPHVIKRYNKVKLAIDRKLRRVTAWTSRSISSHTDDSINRIGRVLADLKELGVEHHVDAITMEFLLLRKLTAE